MHSTWLSQRRNLVRRGEGERIRSLPTTLCKSKATAAHLQRRDATGRLAVVCVPHPFGKSVALGLSFVLAYAITFKFKSMLIVGVSFYDQGPQYRQGYELISQGPSHNVSHDKIYVRNIMRSHPNIHIDYQFDS